MLRWAQLGLTVVDPQIHGLGCLTGEDDGIRPGTSHLGQEKAAALAVADGSGERRPRARGHPALSGDREPGEGTHGHDQDVVGTERIDARRYRPQEQVNGESAAARVLPVDVLCDGLRVDGTSREIVDVMKVAESATDISFLKGPPWIDRR